MRARWLTAGVASLPLVLGCAPRGLSTHGPAAATAGPDVRTAEGRPPVVLVAREGDPAAAVAYAVTTADMGWNAGDDDPEPASALAGLVEDRLARHGIDAQVTPSWDGLRATAIVPSPGDAARVAGVLREALIAPTTAEDLPGARRKLVALGERPLGDDALARFARCTGDPRARPAHAGRDHADVDVVRLERWRAGAFGLGRVAVAVTGPRATVETVATAVLRGPAWSTGAALATHAAESGGGADVVESATAAVPTASVTLDVGTSSVAVDVAEALGDPQGPLAARLGELDVPFRLREVVGVAHARGGCVGAVLEATTAPGRADHDLAARVADAVALVRLEASAHVAETGAARDGRLRARRSGDARASAERAAWWALADRETDGAPREPRVSVVLAMPARRGGTETTPTRESLASALAAAVATWSRAVVEARTRVENGQGEAWMLLASPCGTSNETDLESGLTALAVEATAEAARAEGVSVEPWVVSDGVGILVHGPPLPGEAPAAHARRLADVAGRSFAAEPLTSAILGRARATLLGREARNDGAAMSVLASVLAPQHRSWIAPWGASEPIARSADAAVAVRAQALRAGPLRLAVLANDDDAQAEAAVHAADRWVPRRTGEARACPPPSAAAPVMPGTYVAPLRAGAWPSAYLAFPFTAGDETAHATAELLARALGEERLARTLGPLARDASARVIGWPRAPALALRVAAAQPSLDDAVMQARSLVDALHRTGLAQPDLDRAAASSARAELLEALDPRARLVATWRGTARPLRRVTTEDVRAFAQRYLGEESMVIVAARPPRPPASATAAP